MSLHGEFPGALPFDDSWTYADPMSQLATPCAGSIREPPGLSVMNATGVRVRELPVKIEDLLA